MRVPGVVFPHPAEFPGPVWRGPRMVTQQLLNSWLAVIAMPSSPAFLSMAVIRALTSVTRARSPNAPQSATLRSLECDCAPQKKTLPTVCVAWVPECVGYGPCFIESLWKFTLPSFACSYSLHGAHTKAPLARCGDQAPRNISCCHPFPCFCCYLLPAYIPLLSMQRAVCVPCPHAFAPAKMCLTLKSQWYSPLNLRMGYTDLTTTLQGG